MIKGMKLLGLMVVLGVFTPFFAYAVLSNDPFVEQWGYKDTGVYAAWEKTIGAKRVVVAVIDNGFDYLHPDLQDNLWKNSDEIPNNKVDDDNNGYIDDVWGWNFVPEDSNGDGAIDEIENKGNNNPRPGVGNLSNIEKTENVYSHATAVAGLIGAVGNNNYDGVGVNWKVSLMNLRVLGNSGEGDQIYVAPAIKYAVDNGADILNVSLVALEDIEIKKAVDYAREKGVVVIAAAGNNMIDLNADHLYPICADYGNEEQTVLGVSAIEEGHHMAIFSNSGSQCIDITAPGTSINSLGYYFGENAGKNTKYIMGWKGTSFSAPFVSGAAALIKSIQPEWKAPQIYQALLATVHQTPPRDPQVYKNLFGNGLLQIDKAVTYALNAASPDTLLKTNKKFVLFSPIDGMVTERYIAKEKDGGYGFDTLINTNRILLGRTKDGLVWIVEKKQPAAKTRTGKKNNLSTIEIYDSGWNKKNAWVLPTSGVNGITVGDANADGDDELVVLQNASAANNFKIYNLSGVLLNTYTDKAIPATGFLGVVSGASASFNDLVILNSHRNRTIIQRFSDGRLASVLPVDAVAGVVDFQVADVDADGDEEYLIFGGNGGQSTLAIYQKNGSLSISFPLTGLSARDFGFRVYDYDDDGRKEIIFYPLSSDGVLSVWSNSGDKLMEWALPTEAGSAPRSIKILPLP